MLLHPLECPGGYVVKTGPIMEFADMVTEALQGLDLGMSATALTRIGKSTAIHHVGMKFQEKQTAVWRFWSLADYQTAKKPNEFLRALRGDLDGEDAGLVQQKPLQALLNFCQVECDRLKTSVVVFGLDEAQYLSLGQLDILKDVTNKLVMLGLRPFVLMMAQPEMKHLRDLLFESGHPDLVARFMNKQFVLRGLRAGDVVAFCRTIDELTWPAGSPVTYTAHWVPNLWRSGWRMAAAGAPLWDAFTRLAKEMHIGTDNLEVGGQYVADAVLRLLRLLQQNPRGTEQVATYDAAVRASGFAEFAKVAVMSREAFRSARARRHWSMSRQ